MLNRTSGPLAVYLASLVALVGWSLPANLMAAPVTYTEEAITSGSLGGTSYTNALTTIMFTGDTANVIPGLSPGRFSNRIGTATVTVSGIGTGTFTDLVGAFENQNSPTQFVGINDFTLNLAILGTVDPAFASYDLTTSSGPTSGLWLFNPTTSFDTTAGLFNISTGPPDPSGALISTFTATVSPVPVPPSLLLMGSGMAALAAMRRVRKA